MPARSSKSISASPEPRSTTSKALGAELATTDCTTPEKESTETGSFSVSTICLVSRSSMRPSVYCVVSR